MTHHGGSSLVVTIMTKETKMTLTLINDPRVNVSQWMPLNYKLPLYILFETSFGLNRKLFNPIIQLLLIDYDKAINHITQEIIRQLDSDRHRETILCMQDFFLHL
jgi:hypothetical protein